MKFTILSLLISLPAFAAEAPKPAEAISSPHGDVKILREERLFSVTLSDRIIYQEEISIEGNPVVIKNGNLKNESYLILSAYRGDGCPSTNILITWKKQMRGYQVAEFGNCNNPKITVAADRIQIKYPSSVSKEHDMNRKVEEWEYSKGILKRTDKK